jgi:hypothetical protein
MMKMWTLCTVALLALGVGGCDKKKEGEGGAAGAPKATGEAGGKGGKAAAPALLTACPEGTTKNEEHNFCLKLAPDIKVVRTNDNSGMKSLTYGDGKSPPKDFGISVYTDKGRFENTTSMHVDALKDPDKKIIEQIDLPGGGKFHSYDDKEGYRWTESWATGSKTSVTCGTRRSVAFEDTEGVDTICKSLVVL